MQNVNIHFDVSQLYSLAATWQFYFVVGLLIFSVSLNVSKKELFDRKGLVKPILVALLLQFLILPVMTGCFVWLFGFSGPVAIAFFLIAACPGGRFTMVYTWMSGGSLRVGLVLSFLTVALSFVCAPVVFYLLSSAYPLSREFAVWIQLEDPSVIVPVMSLIVFPAIVGVIVGQRFPTIVEHFSRPMGTIAFIFIIFYSLIGIFENYVQIKPLLPWVIWITLLHNLLSLGISYFVARSSGLNPPEVKAVTFSSSLFHLFLALEITRHFFPQLQIIFAITAVWTWVYMLKGLIVSFVWGNHYLSLGVLKQILLTADKK